MTTTFIERDFIIKDYTLLKKQFENYEQIDEDTTFTMMIYRPNLGLHSGTDNRPWIKLFNATNPIKNFPEYDCILNCGLCFCCVCGKEHLKNISLIKSNKTEEHYIIGSICISKFIEVIKCAVCNENDVKKSSIAKGDYRCSLCKTDITKMIKFITEKKEVKIEFGQYLGHTISETYKIEKFITKGGIRKPYHEFLKEKATTKTLDKLKDYITFYQILEKYPYLETYIKLNLG